MSRTFKINPESKEATTRTKRYGNSRKKRAEMEIKERRRHRKALEELYEREQYME